MQERIELQDRARLLSRGDHHRRAVLERGEDVGHRMAHARGRMQVHEARAARGLGVAVGHANDHGLLQAQHIGKILGVVAKQRQLGRAGVAENARHAELAQQVYHRMADGERSGILGGCLLHGGSLAYNASCPRR
ncbi:hypothetical protein D3C78_1519110 [compost metagenome]